MHVQSCWVAFAQQRLHYDKFWFGAVLTWWWSVSHTDKLSQPVATVAGQDCYKSSCWPVLHRSTGFKKQTAPIILPWTTGPWTPISEGLTGKSRLSSRCWGLRGWEGGGLLGGDRLGGDIIGSGICNLGIPDKFQPCETKPQIRQNIPNMRNKSPTYENKAPTYEVKPQMFIKIINIKTIYNYWS